MKIKYRKNERFSIVCFSLKHHELDLLDGKIKENVRLKMGELHSNDTADIVDINISVSTIDNIRTHNVYVYFAII